MAQLPPGLIPSSADRPVNEPTSVVDAHVHFWDPAIHTYPWLNGLPALRRKFGPAEFGEAARGVPLDGMIFVECNCLPEEAPLEVESVVDLSAGDGRIVGLVGFADLTRPDGLSELLDRYEAHGKVRGIRHNIQGTEPGFCLRTSFVDGVREAGRRELTFDLCATHDQLGEVVELARKCPGTALVLDHCGKPAIRERVLDPWRAHLHSIAALPHTSCKLSGLLTEADPAGWADDDLLPYADHAVECFGTDRVMYGGDWPVLTLAGTYREWYQFTLRFTAGWNGDERAAFYAGNALRSYGIL